jgi:hypothetical protein
MHRYGAAVALGLSIAMVPAGTARAEDAPAAAPSATDADKARTAAPATDAEKARALFREGRALADDGKFEEACSKFEESRKLDNGIGTLFNLADCLEHTGHFKKAMAVFLRVADAAHEKGQTDREQVARERARALEEKVPKLGSEVKELVDGLEVKVDGDPVDRTSWATGVRVDPGKHEIAAKAPHKKSWALTVEVGASSTLLMITVPKLDDEAPKVAAPVKSVPEEKPAQASRPRAEPDDREGSSQLAKILLLGGAGAGVVLAGTGLAIYKMSNDNAKDVCPSSTGCTVDDVQRHDGFLSDATMARTLGYVGLGVTGAALLGFTVVTLSARPSREGARGASVSAGPLPMSGWGASVRGRF